MSMDVLQVIILFLNHIYNYPYYMINKFINIYNICNYFEFNIRHDNFIIKFAPIFFSRP